ncbi:hypothetical protein QA597_03675 [Marinilabiliaceae bacterium ANBcel2]|nr:hypothetical protein [Marinilabiliaceae bacterium ANBcel2]
MEAYLLELIKENNRIIIPDFGAFIVSREKGQNILFNNFLTFNDRLLVKHICAVEGVDSDTALNKIKDYVNKISSELDSSGYFHINGIGKFIKDDNGVLRFEQEESEVDVSSSKRDSSSDQSQISVTDISEDDRVKESSSDDGLLDLDSDDESNLAKPDIDDSDSSSSVEPEEASYNESKAEPSKTVTSSEEKKSNKKSGKGFFKWILIILLLIGGAIIYSLFFTSLFDKDEEIDDSEAVPTEQVDDYIPEELPVNDKDDETIEKSEEVDSVEPAAPVRQHHIILASFANENEAQSRVAELHNLGITEAKVLPHEGRYLISAEWHESVSHAYRRQEYFAGDKKMENWILSITR